MFPDEKPRINKKGIHTLKVNSFFVFKKENNERFYMKGCTVCLWIPIINYSC
jgi:hypothetical protein